MSFENPTTEPVKESEVDSEEYKKVMRIIGSIKYVASPEDPGNSEDKLKEIVDYAQQLEVAVKELK